MVRYYKIWAVGCWLLAIGTLFSCQEGGDAGDLFGMWRLTGSDSQYISFSGSVTRLTDTTDKTEYVYGNFQHEDDSLFIQLYSEKGLQKDTIMVEDTFGFKPFNNIRLRIETLNDDRLVLSKDGRIWSFYKY